MDFSLRSKPTVAEREKSGRHKPLQCRRAQPDGRPERAAAPQVAWRKTRNNAAWSDYLRAAVLQARWADEGRRVPRASSFSCPQRGLRCGASTFGQDSGRDEGRSVPRASSFNCPPPRIAMWCIDVRPGLRPDDGRGRQNQRGCRWVAREAAGSDKAIDRDFSGPAGFTTDCATVGAR